MFRRNAFAISALLAIVFAIGKCGAQSATKLTQDLRVAMVDVEGGAAILFVTPEGKSLLIDTGWPPGMGGTRARSGPPLPSSAERIQAVAESLGIKKIDYLIMTHYHIDHLGGVDSLLAKLPIGTFIDHGPNREELASDATPQEIFIAPVNSYPKWVAAYAGHEHITAVTGRTLDIGSMHIEFVTSDGKVLDKSLPGAGMPNNLCAGVSSMERDGGEENARSVGVLITFGKTRILDLGDLTWNKEIELLCPVNRIGKVDIFVVDGHGMDISSSPPTAALAPTIALMENGPTKGGDEPVIKTVSRYPELKGFWRNHYSVRYPDLNGDPNYIANLESARDHSYWIGLDITAAGLITVTNSRNNFSKRYEARGAH